MKLQEYMNGLQEKLNGDLTLEADHNGARAEISVLFRPAYQKETSIDASDIDAFAVRLTASKDDMATKVAIDGDQVIDIDLSPGLKLKNIRLERKSETDSIGYEKMIEEGIRQKIWPCLMGGIRGFQWKSGREFDPNQQEMIGDLSAEWDQVEDKGIILFQEKERDEIVRLFQMVDPDEYRKLRHVN